jgi:hypothetical protein
MRKANFIVADVQLSSGRLITLDRVIAPTWGELASPSSHDSCLESKRDSGIWRSRARTRSLYQCWRIERSPFGVNSAMAGKSSCPAMTPRVARAAVAVRNCQIIALAWCMAASFPCHGGKFQNRALRRRTDCSAELHSAISILHGKHGFVGLKR